MTRDPGASATPPAARDRVGEEQHAEHREQVRLQRGERGARPGGERPVLAREVQEPGEPEQREARCSARTRPSTTSRRTTAPTTARATAAGRARTPATAGRTRRITASELQPDPQRASPTAPGAARAACTPPAPAAGSTSSPRRVRSGSASCCSASSSSGSYGFSPRRFTPARGPVLEEVARHRGTPGSGRAASAAKTSAAPPTSSTRPNGRVGDMREFTRAGSDRDAADGVGVAGQVEHVEAAAEHGGRRAVAEPRERVRVVQEHAEQVVRAHDHDVPRGVGRDRFAAGLADAAVARAAAGSGCRALRAGRCRSTTRYTTSDAVRGPCTPSAAAVPGPSRGSSRRRTGSRRAARRRSR